MLTPHGIGKSRSLDFVTYALAALLAIVVFLSVIPQAAAALPFNCQGETKVIELQSWQYPPGFVEGCTEEFYTDMTLSEALTECATRIDEIKASDPNFFVLGACGTSHDLDGITHVIQNGYDNSTNHPERHYRFTLDIAVGGYCPEPSVPNSAATSRLNTCQVICPADRPFTSKYMSCMPEEEAAQSCESQVGNPVNFLTGDKYLIETDYKGAGAFPLEFTRYYHSHNNTEYDGRSEWKFNNDPARPVSITYFPRSSFNSQRRFSPYSQGPKLVLVHDSRKNRERLSERWRHNYDRYLFASFGYSVIDPIDIPPLVRLYRPDGKVEYYKYNGQTAAYESQNGFTSKITRLPANHELAPGWHVVNMNNEVEIYDLEGKFLKLTSASGLSHRLIYDAGTQSKLVRVEDDFGHSLQFEYSGNRPIKMTDPEGNDYLYTFSDEKLTKIVYPDQTPTNASDNPTKIYHYENATFPGALTGITDENGDRYSTYGYDLAGRAVSTELANGVSRTAVVIDSVNNTRTLTNPLGKQSVYNLSATGLILNVNGLESSSGLCAAASQSNTFDGRGFKTRTVDWSGNVTNYVRDARGLELSRTEAFGTSTQRTINTTWHSVFRLPTQVIEPGRATSMTYDSLGHLLTLTETDTTNRSVPYSTNGQSRTTTFSYYPAGVNGAFQLSSVNGPRTDVNDITSYQYTAEGFLSTVTNALGHQVQITSHNSRGLPLAVVDENGVATEFTYHPRGWLLSSTVKHPSQAGGSLDAVTSFQYDNAGQVTRITLPNNSFLDYQYDAAHRLVAISNNLNESISYTLDAAGNVTREATTGANSQITQVQTRVFDELSRLYRDVGGASQLSQFAYDVNDNLVEGRSDPSGLNQTTHRAFDGLNRLVGITDALQGASEYGYDRRDNLTSVTDERGLTTYYVYDGFDNLLALDSPDTGITIYTYDRAGNVIKEIDARGVEKQFTYDALNRVTLEHYPGDAGEDIVYLYDQGAGIYGTGRLTGLQDQTGTTAYVYDHRGNQIEINTTLQSAAYTTQFEYDLADNLTRTTYPSGRVVDQQLDMLGRVTAVTTRADENTAAVPVVSNVEYLPFGPLAGLEYGNELATELSYDQDYRLTDIATTDVSGGSGPNVLALHYALNAVNNIVDIDNTVDPNRSQVFAYDPLNRLTGAGGIYGLLYYDYDAVGNRIQQRRVVGTNATTETYTYFPDSNSIASRQEGGNFRFYQYDASGNVRSDGNAIYFYDRQNRLIEVAE